MLCYYTRSVDVKTIDQIIPKVKVKQKIPIKTLKGDIILRIFASDLLFSPESSLIL